MTSSTSAMAAPWTLEELSLEMQRTVRTELQSLRGVLADELRESLKQAGFAQQQPCNGACCGAAASSGQMQLATGPLPVPLCQEAPARPEVELQAAAQHGAIPNANSGERMLQLHGSQKEDAGQHRHTVSAKAFQRKKVQDFQPSGAGTVWERISRTANIMVAHHIFDYASATLVILNAVWIGHQTDCIAQSWATLKPSYFDLGDGLFCLLAVIEVSIRMLAEGGYFFYGASWRWNWFDLVLASSQVADIGITMFFPSAGHNSLLRLLRICKLVRIARIARIAAAFPELHVLISSVVDSLSSLFWTLLLIGAFLFAVAIAITQVVNEHKIDKGVEHMEAHEEAILEFYGTLSQTMLSLYMVISEGIHWSELMEPLAEHISPSMKAVFVVFVAFQLFAMMNVITAIFVDNAMKIAAKEERDEVLGTLWNMMQADVGSAGFVTLEVFQKHFDSPAMVRFLELTGAECEDCQTVFRLIDASGDGALDATEFVDSCGHLVGSARAMQAAQLTAVMKDHISECFNSLRRLLESKRSETDPATAALDKTQQEILKQSGEMTSKLGEVIAKLNQQPSPASTPRKQSWLG
eukprot:TRINITY_DN4508_c0_g2_i1.p1 TRINITY_DN4508_c0_g2~~TRINITY_DN4508_c0_g2_i1.p1  ORF type:complete len:582 (-),score=113.76 TRINITY_DN4508_c0_g2_i1:107-1852(-)